MPSSTCTALVSATITSVAPASASVSTSRGSPDPASWSASVANGDGTWRLIGPDDSQIFRTSLSSDVDPLALPLDGTYTLLLEGRHYASARNAYEFNVQPVSDDAAALTLGATVNGAIDHPGQVDRYGFTLSGQSRLYFDSLSSDSNLSWSLTGPRGTAVSGRNLAASDSADLGGNPLLDLESRRAVIVTQRISPLPEQFTRPTLTVYLTFEYKR